MDVAESPERDPHSPEDEEQPQGLSDDDILRDSGSDQDLDGAGVRASDLEDEESAARGPSQEEEDNHSDEEDRASEPKSQDQDSEDDDLEEGEVKDPSDRKVRPRPTCRFFMKGNCTWGMNCRFIHPGVNDKGNYSLITKADPFPPNGAPPLGPHPLMPANPWGGPVVDEILPPPPPEPPTESAWERGLRHAKEVLKK
ncbi:zinc finger CCCH-type containing 18, partial [Homo sapiens]